MQTPDTIVLIHGVWMTPRCWEHWVPYYEARGFRVLAPPWPGFEVEVEALRENPSLIERLDTQTIAHQYETIIRSLDKPPIIIGHSFGGALTQIMLDRGLGAAGVAIDSVPVKGVHPVAVDEHQVALADLEEPGKPPQGGRVHARAVPLRVHQHDDRRGVAADLRAICDSMPGQARVRGRRPRTSSRMPQTTVDFEKEDRAPLLFIGGSEITSCRPSSIAGTSSTTSRASSRSTSSRDATTSRAEHRLGGRRRLRARVGARAGRERRAASYWYRVEPRGTATAPREVMQTPDTIVLIHGVWLTPRSWEFWVPYYEARGFRVLAPPWPGFEIEVEALRENPSVIEKLDVATIAHHYESIIRSLDKPPIIIGHSFGGAFTQILLDRGLGAAGVAIDSVPVKGVIRAAAGSTIKSI